MSKSTVEGLKRGEGIHPLLLLLFAFFPVPSSSFLGSDGILSKQDQGRAVILGDSQMPQPLSGRNT